MRRRTMQPEPVKTELEPKPQGLLQQAERRLEQAQAELEQVKRQRLEAEARIGELNSALAGTNDLDQLAELQAKLSAAQSLAERLREREGKAQTAIYYADLGLRNTRANVNHALGVVRHWQDHLAGLDGQLAALYKQIEHIEGAKRGAQQKLAQALDELQKLGGTPDMPFFEPTEVLAPPRR